MNGINSIRFDINSTRYDHGRSRKRINPIEQAKSATETDKKSQLSVQHDKNFNSFHEPANKNTSLLLTDRKYYRANLLGEIVNKMSGVQSHFQRGQYIEYYV